jgi:hypothetical protein
MKTAFTRIAPLSLLGLMAVSSNASAQATLIDRTSENTSVDRSFESSPKDCSDVRWSQAAQNAFPAIGEACQAVEERDGKTFVKFEGVVEKVGDMGNRIRVDFNDGKTMTFTPAPQTVLYIDGERTPFAEVREGMNLNFYVPEDRLQAELRPDPARIAFIVFPFDAPTVSAEQARDRLAQADTTRDTMRSQNASRDRMTAANGDGAELPDTAGPLPLLGVGGLAFLFGASGLALRRKLRR